MTGPLPHRHLECEELGTRVDCWRVARTLTEEQFLFLLDSAGEPCELGRYSVLAWDPRWEFLAKDGVACSGPPGKTEPLAGDVLSALDQAFEAFAVPTSELNAAEAPAPVFSGGAVGFFAYELLHEIESVPRNGAPDLGVLDCHLLFCDTVLVTDEIAGRSWLLSNGWGATEEQSRADARARFREARAKCREAPHQNGRLGGRFEIGDRLSSDDLDACGIEVVTDPDHYLDLVNEAREHILAGDAFEVCLTHQFRTQSDISGVELYAAMRTVNPAPMAAYLRFPDLEVLSCSPERFLRVDADRWAETRPIKGTRPRGRTPLEDEAFRVDLATAVKDGAENMMIVDLARNDLGRVCDFGSVHVPSMCAVERYPSVFQLVSTVRGHLEEGITPVELIRAAFPGGSMTGAPKIEAMRLISRMEDSRRGVFSGAIGYVNYSGELDLNIVIRTVVKRGDSLSFHTGGAITADSDAEEEYQETLDKAHALVRAIGVARGSRQATGAVR